MFWCPFSAKRMCLNVYTQTLHLPVLFGNPTNYSHSRKHGALLVFGGCFEFQRGSWRMSSTFTCLGVLWCGDYEVSRIPWGFPEDPRKDYKNTCFCHLITSPNLTRFALLRRRSLCQAQPAKCLAETEAERS